MKGKQAVAKARRKSMPRSLDGKIKMLGSFLKAGEALGYAAPRSIWNHSMIEQFKVESKGGGTVFMGGFHTILVALQRRKALLDDPMGKRQGLQWDDFSGGYVWR